ncbi:MAG TPA: hypothetical protein VLL75_04040 [Vicinamibacteria bacterium]|nr:hypothetical protein [Vicinamibacteria bacterium]
MTGKPAGGPPPAGRGAPDWPFVAVALAFVAAPALFWGGRAVFDETLGFILRRYWSGRSFLQIVFDPRGWDFYQARELSYAVDFLDAQWVRSLLSRDVLFLVPPSSIVASLAVVVIGLRLAPRALPSLDRATRWLVLLVFLSNFVFLSTMGWLYRATKPLVAPLLLGLLLLVVAEHRRARLGPRAGFAAVFATALTMSLLDRQGLFYLLALGGGLALAFPLTRRGLPLALGAFAAAAAWAAYNYALGPWVIHALNGYWPEFRFQRLRPARLLQPHPWLAAVDLLGDWTSVLLGGLPPLVLAAAAAAAGAGWAWRNRRRRGRLGLGLAVGAAAMAGQVAMVALMVQRHDPVTWADHRLWYYPLPYQALVAFGLLWALDHQAAVPRPSHARGTLRASDSTARLTRFALGALVVANVAQWPEKRQVMQSEPAFAQELRGSLLLSRALEGTHADPSLAGDHRRFYFECLDRFPRIAARALPQVNEGEGVFRPEVRGGRLIAWAGREARLLARTRTAGRFVLAGRVRLRPGNELSIVFGSPPRLLAEVPRAGTVEGDEGFRVALDLPAGVSEVRLLSAQPEAPVPDEPQEAAFALLLPMLLWPEPGGSLSPIAPSAIVPAGPVRGPLAASLPKGIHP